jgi:hypothetical protein
MSIVNIAMIVSANATPIKGDPGMATDCFQTMGYCGYVLTYKCTPDYTSESCRLRTCHTCTIFVESE